MFSYFESTFIEKFLWESGISNFGHVTVSRNGNSFFGLHFETVHFLNVCLFVCLFVFVLFCLFVCFFFGFFVFLTLGVYRYGISFVPKFLKESN